jgi:hypothetical protein
MAKYLSNRQKNLKVGITSYTENKTVLEVVGNANFSGIITATTFSGTSTYATNSGIATNLKGGLVGNIPYQSAPDTTAFLANGFEGYVLQSNGTGSVPTWVPAAPSGAVTGLVVRDVNNTIVGTASSVSQLTIGTGLSVTGTPGPAGIATITLSSNIVGTSLSISGITTTATLNVGTGGTVITTTSAGSVGIGTTNPTSKLHVVGDAYISGVLTVTDINSTSDIRYKENIQPIPDAVEKVLQLNGVTFDWKTTKTSSAGVIAQEVEKILPTLISGDDPKTVNYNGIIGLLVEAVKELSYEIEMLKQKD